VTNGPIVRGQCRIIPRFKDRDHLSVLPRFGKVMGAENRIEDTGEEGNRLLGKMLQCPVRLPFGPGALLTLRPLIAS